MKKDILILLKEMQFSMSAVKYARDSVLKLYKGKIKEKEDEVYLINMY